MANRADPVATNEKGLRARTRAAQVEAALADLALAVVLAGQASGDVLADALTARRAIEAFVARQHDEDEIAAQLTAYRSRLRPLAYITARGAIYAGASQVGNRQLCDMEEAVQACGALLRNGQRGGISLLDEHAAFSAWEAAAEVLSPYEAWKARGALAAPWRWSHAMHMLAKIRQDGYLSDSMSAQITAHLTQSRYELEASPGTRVFARFHCSSGRPAIMSLAGIRSKYGVPAYQGARVRHEAPGKPICGTVTRSTSGGRIFVRLDGDSFSTPFHPTWNLTYLPSPTQEKK
jgi:hypothetical protein